MKSQEKTESAEKRVKIRKLAPPKPFPPVAASVSATGPRSAHKEGKNFIYLTRKTSLGAYMRRCKNLIMNDGYKILHLHAAGAAIPLLMQLSCALPSILPFPKDEIHTEISTGTVEVQDEIIPDDEDEDITYRTRGKSTLYVVIRIGDGQSEKDGSKPIVTDEGSKPKKPKSRPKKTAGSKAVLVFEEPEQEQEDI
ncbi:Ribonuclease P protein subunit p20 [Leucoagaricus sp. SymC.cos]|nr:Ribonuclease P protein subunit p20 [Leucoagaricus sp. SymC.cos]